LPGIDRASAIAAAKAAAWKAELKGKYPKEVEKRQ